MPRITGKLTQAATGIPIVDGADVANVAPEFATLAELRAATLETRNVYGNSKRWLWNGESTATDDGTENATAVQRTGVATGRYLPNPAQAAISVLTPSGTEAAASIVTSPGITVKSGALRLFEGAIGTWVTFTSDASEPVLAVSLAGLLDASSEYHATLSVRVLFRKTSANTDVSSVDFSVDLYIATDGSGVATCTFQTTPSPDPSRLKSTVMNCTATAAASAGGFTISATRESGQSMQARATWWVTEFTEL